MKTVYIYTLADPTNGQIRYVGKTRNLFQRRHNHLNSCRDKNTHKRNWVNQLRRLGYLPVMEVIDEVPESEWKYWEKYWIQQTKSWGFNLVNHTEGGDGLSFGNQTSFKPGLQPWNKGKSKPKPVKPPRGKSPNTVKFQFQPGHPSWRRGLRGVKNKPDKNVHQYSALTGKYIATWRTARHASVELNINEEGIGQCARGKAKTAGGFIWSYDKYDCMQSIIYTGKTNNRVKTKLK